MTGFVKIKHGTNRALFLARYPESTAKRTKLMRLFMNIYEYMNRLNGSEKTYETKEKNLFYVYVYQLVMYELIKRKLTNYRSINFVLSFTIHGNKTKAYQETHPRASKQTANGHANKFSKRSDVYVAQSIGLSLMYKDRLSLAMAIKEINVNGIEQYVNKLILEVLGDTR
jgi:hypothetical protein